MSEKPAISILIPACNEEAFIGATLAHLEPLAEGEVEVLVGLDGCTDGTEGIVRSFPFVRVFSWPDRRGKSAVLNDLGRQARAPVRIVHDVDWTLVANRASLARLAKDFRDDSLGAVALPPHNLPFDVERSQVRSRTFRMAAIAVNRLHEFLLEKQCLSTPAGLFVDRSRIVFPMPINIYRAEAVGELSTVADDFERFEQIAADPRWKIKVYNSPGEPYFSITRKSFSFSEHYRRRVRGHLARAQMAPSRGAVSADFRRQFLRWCWARRRKLGRDLLDIAVWLGIIAVARFHAGLLMRGGVPSAREAWKMRDSRKTP